MDEKIQDAKGRAKEAAGVVTGNENLENEGKADQTAASIKDKVGNIIDSVKDKIGDFKKK